MESALALVCVPGYMNQYAGKTGGNTQISVKPDVRKLDYNYLL